MKENIYNFIINNERITFRKLCRNFDIDTNELKDILKELKIEGKILQKEDYYIAFPSDLYIGLVSSSASGRKFISYDNKKINIDNAFINNIFLHDKVAFKINEHGDATIVSILDRTLGKVTCEVVVDDGKKMIVPQNNNYSFILDKDAMNELYDGDIIVVDIQPGEEFGYNNYTFIKKLGRRDDPTIDDAAIALSYGFDDDYSDEFMAEVRALPTEVKENDLVNRVDYRDQASFTIDGAYTKDMDDGVYAEVIDDNVIRVYVHIADVSHYIKLGSAIFDRVCEKTTSLYLNNSVYHMLHHIISNGICSLNPNTDRLAKTVIIDIDKDGKIINYDLCKSVINSKKKMVYEDVDKVLMNDQVPDGYQPFKRELYILYDAALRLEKQFIQNNGKIDFVSSELDIKYNTDGSIKDINDPEDSISRKIIENLMIAANHCAISYGEAMGLPMVYRVHDYPDVRKINAIINELIKSGYKIRPVKDVSDPKVIQKMLNSMRTYPEYPIISGMLVTAMQRASYSVENSGHYALGMDIYGHFTSPIRRLSDLLNHMILDIPLVEYDKYNEEILGEYYQLFKELARRASIMERQADCAERLAERRLILKKLEKNSDKTYEATVLETGKYIKLRVEGIDTYINSHALDQVFTFDSKRKIYYDKETGTIIKLGTKLLVDINNVSSISDKFSVLVKGISISEDAKKKVLKK